MQRTKIKKSFSEIESYCKEPQLLPHIYQQILGEYNLSYIEKLFGKVKKQGVNGGHVFRTLFVLRFLDFSNIHQLMQSGLSNELSYKKDVFYSFLNNPRIDWRNILWLFAKQSLKIIGCKSQDSNDAPKCLIVDDSTLHKSGKAIELIGKVFDHGCHTFKLGMKLLTIGYNDGKSFLPMDCSLHNEPGKNKNRGMKAKELAGQYSKIRKEDSPGHQRQMEVGKSKMETALYCIKRLLKKGLKVDYVLADSWFICENFIRSILSQNKRVGVIGLIKSNRIISLGGKRHKANMIPEIYRRDIHQCKKLKCYYIKKKIEYKGIAMNGYWIRMRGQEQWSLLISTRQDLSFIKAMKIYQVRWSIEVFFKDCRQNLNLNACQSKDLDAHIATISLVFMNYIALSLKKRFEDYETLGLLFRDFSKIMLHETLVQRTWKVIVELFGSLLPALGVDWNKFMKIVIEKQESMIDELQKNLQDLSSLSLKHAT